MQHHSPASVDSHPLVASSPPLALASPSAQARVNDPAAAPAAAAAVAAAVALPLDLDQPPVSQAAASRPRRSARCGTFRATVRDYGRHVNGRFKAAFPDPSVRIWFLLCVFAVIGLSLYWLQYTIVQKWMAATSSPQQRFSFEPVTALPAFFGVGIVAVNTGPPVRQMTIPIQLSILTDNWVPDITVAAFVSCAPIPGFQFTVCQPVDAQKKPLLMQSDEATQVLVGRDALRTATTTWPRKLQLRATSESFCFTSHMLLNQSIIDTWPTPIIPALNVIFLSASELRSAMTAVAGSFSQKLHAAQLVPPAHSVLLDTYTELAASATQRFDLHGRSELTYQHAPLGSTPLRNRFNNSLFQLLNYSLAQQTQDVRDDWNQVMATDGIRYAQTITCVRPASFNVQIIQEIQTYTFQSFVSEVGGYIQVLIISFSLLFPLLWSVAAQPRTFLLTRMWAQARLLVASDEAKVLALDSPDTNEGSDTTPAAAEAAGIDVVIELGNVGTSGTSAAFDSNKPAPLAL